MTAGVWGRGSHFQSTSCSVQHHDGDISKPVDNFGCIQNRKCIKFLGSNRECARALGDLAGSQLTCIQVCVLVLFTTSSFGHCYMDIIIIKQ